MGLVEDERSVMHSVKGSTDGDEVGQDLVGLVERVADDVGVDLGELSAVFAIVKEM